MAVSQWRSASTTQPGRKTEERNRKTVRRVRKAVRQWQDSVAGFSSASVQRPHPVTLPLVWQLKIHASAVPTTLWRAHDNTFKQAANMQMNTVIQQSVWSQRHAQFMLHLHSGPIGVQHCSIQLTPNQCCRQMIWWNKRLHTLWLRGKH